MECFILINLCVACSPISVNYISTDLHKMRITLSTYVRDEDLGVYGATVV